MARAAMPKRSKKAKMTRTPKFVDEKYTGPEPDWDGSDKWTAEKYYKTRSRIGFYYNYFFASKDGATWILDWMKKNEYNKADIACVKAVPDSYIGITFAGMCRALNKGMPSSHPGLAEYIETLPGVGENAMRDAVVIVREKIAELIERGRVILSEKKEVEVSTKNIYKPSIQELLRDKAFSMTEELEEFVDGFDNKKETLKEFDPLTILQKQEAKANHANIIRKQYVNELNELIELTTPPKRMNAEQTELHEQLKEGFAHLSKSEIQALIDMYKSIVDACDMIVQQGKVNRAPRKKKPISKEKLVANFKYMESHNDTKSVSVKPIDLLGAVAAIVYNVKTRKLGIYVAEDAAGFNIKGTSLIGFNETQSVQKTLRKPAEQLGVFKKITKRSLQKEFDVIKSVETKMNGRFNDQTLILKVF